MGSDDEVDDPDWAGDWSDWDDDPDAPAEVPLLGGVEAAAGVPHKYRVILNWILAGLLVYLIFGYLLKKRRRSGYPAARAGVAGPVAGRATGAQRIAYDQGSQRWLVDVGDWCQKDMCSSDRIANELCSYTCSAEAADGP